MIRRRIGNSFALIRQVDHAAIAADIAQHLGTQRYQRPTRFQSLLNATRLHDSGWGVHDDAPQLDPRGYPLDAFEMPCELDLACWAGGPPTAAPAGNWAELLVSLHVLALSGYLAARPGNATARDRFEMNKFQHREIERQERLRRALGLSTEMPLTMGLAEEGTDPLEDELRTDLRWLQAFDLLSLAACCDRPPQDHTPNIYPTPNDPGEPLRLRKEANDVLVTPWPFAIEQIHLTIPAKLIPAHPYTTARELHLTLTTAPQTEVHSTLRPH
jgi:hypothetical protein